MEKMIPILVDLDALERHYQRSRGEKFEPIPEEKSYSKLFDESYSLVDNTYVFQSGVSYDFADVKILKNSCDETKKFVHQIKKIFPGTIVVAFWNKKLKLKVFRKG
jgi:hypothetical protein